MILSNNINITDYMFMSTEQTFSLVKSVFPVFIGACLAFVFNFWLEAKKQRQSDIAAGNLALFAIKSQFQEFLLFRVDFRRQLNEAEQKPLYLSILPSLQTYVGHTINFNSLGFLLAKSGYGKLFDVLHEAQSYYQELIKFHELRNIQILDLHRRIADFQANNSGQTMEDYLNKNFPDLLKQIESIIKSSFQRTENDEVYQKAFDRLRKALVKELGRSWANAWLCKASFLKMSLPDEKFRKSSLPPLSVNLLSKLTE